MSRLILYGVSGALARRLRSLGLPWRAPEWPGGDRPRPAVEHNLGVDYDSEWSRRYPVRLVRAVVVDNVTRPLAHAVASPNVRGNELLALPMPRRSSWPITRATRHRVAHVCSAPSTASLHDRRGRSRLLLRQTMEGPYMGGTDRRESHRAPPGEPQIGGPGCGDDRRGMESPHLPRRRTKSRRLDAEIPSGVRPISPSVPEAGCSGSSGRDGQGDGARGRQAATLAHDGDIRDTHQAGDRRGCARVSAAV